MSLVDGVDVEFFVVGMGRSGTRWITSALKSNGTVRVFHESFYRYDRPRYHITANESSKRQQYLDERIKIVRGWQKNNPHMVPFGEVNGYLRYCVPELIETFGVPVLGLIRDGRKTVRSLLFHNIYKEPYSPEVKVPYAFAGDQFASCCWYWADTYRRLISASVPILRLEDLNDYYAAFQHACEHLGIAVSEKDWRRRAGKRVGVKIQDTGPPQWDEAQNETFEAVAGDIQSIFYPSID